MSLKQSLTAFRESLGSALEAIRDHCVQNKETIAVAESVTAGGVQLLLSTAEGAPSFFQGGITVYNCAQKAIHLRIEPIFAESCNGVDQRIAADMARNVCTLFCSQIGVAITGYANKVPEQGIDTLYAYMAIVRNGKVIHQGRIEPLSEGINAQWEYAGAVIRILAGSLQA